MINNTLLSVIIPVYNLETKIEKCLRSLILQELKELEIIVINDGSTDSSLEVIKNISKEDSRIKIINKKNSGASATRNEGLKYATGKYITYLDGDDYLEKNAYKKMIEKCEKEELDCLICDFYYDYSSYKKIFYDFKIYDEFKIIKKEDYLKNLFSWKNSAPAVWNKIIKKEVYLKENLKFQEDIFLGEDFSLTARLIMSCKNIGKLNQVLINYVQHSEQGTKKKKESFILDLFLAHDKIEEFYEKKKKLDEYKEILENSKFLSIYRDFFRLNFNLNKPKERKAVLRFLMINKEIRNIQNYKKMSIRKKIKYNFKKFYFLKIKNKNLIKSELINEK